MTETLPKSWSDVTTEQFIALRHISETDYATKLSYKLEQLSILLNRDIDDVYWNDIDTEQMQQMFESIKFIEKQPSLNYKNEITDEYCPDWFLYFKGFDTLTLGEFIDLEHLFSEDYIIKLPQICAVMFRHNKNDSWGHNIIEPRRYDEVKRAQKFYGLMITDIYGILQGYIDFKKKFLLDFEFMFEEPDEEAEIIEDIDLTPEDKKAKDYTAKLSKWSWENIIYNLSNKDVTKFDAITELPLVFVFNQLSMQRDLNS